MTALAALASALVRGESVSIMTGFKDFLITNVPREIGRSIERKFDVRVHRVPVKFKSTYGRTGEYFRYTLIPTSENRPGIKRMREYIKEQVESTNPKTDKQARLLKQATLL